MSSICTNHKHVHFDSSIIFFLNFLKSKKLKNRELIFKKFLPCQIANAAKKKKLLYIILTRHTVYF